MMQGQPSLPYLGKIKYLPCPRAPFHDLPVLPSGQPAYIHAITGCSSSPASVQRLLDSSVLQAAPSFLVVEDLGTVCNADYLALASGHLVEPESPNLEFYWRQLLLYCVRPPGDDVQRETSFSQGSCAFPERRISGIKKLTPEYFT